MKNLLTTTIYKQVLFCLIIIISAVSNSYSQAPLQDWYKSYYPDEDRQEDPITQLETGEDWFYDIKESKDIRTGKVDGFIAVGYQRYQCAPNGSYNTVCGEPQYEELRDNERMASVNNFGTMWFLDLYGNEKWYIDIGEDYVNTTTTPPFINLYSVIQTYDGNYVAVGTAGFMSDVMLNPTSSSMVYPTATNMWRTYVVKIDKNTHSVIWQYYYDMSTGDDVNHWSGAFDLVEDPDSHELLLSTRSKQQASPYV